MSNAMEYALKAVEDMTGDKVICAAFKSIIPPKFDPHEHGDAWLVYRYPEHYQLVKGRSGHPDVYIEGWLRPNRDKHFWVEAHLVERIRNYYSNMERNEQ